MVRKSPTRAVREKCLDRCRQSPLEVRLRPTTGCLLWPWRFGKNPRTTQRQQPEWLNPVYAGQMGEQQCRSEMRSDTEHAEMIDISPSLLQEDMEHHETVE